MVRPKLLISSLRQAAFFKRMINAESGPDGVLMQEYVQTLVHIIYVSKHTPLHYTLLTDAFDIMSHLIHQPCHKICADYLIDGLAVCLDRAPLLTTKSIWDASATRMWRGPVRSWLAHQVHYAPSDGADVARRAASLVHHLSQGPSLLQQPCI